MENQTIAKPTGSIPGRDPDEINLLDYFYALVHRKMLIVGVTVAGMILGYFAAIIKGPTWLAEAVIAPKDVASQKAPSFAGLGALGGLVASQMNLGGNASLDKIDIILDSREFNARLVEKYNLLPVIYKYQAKKVYNKMWDTTTHNWRPDFIKPKPLDVGNALRGAFLKKTVNKNNTMSLMIKSKDSSLTINLATNYVSFLDDYIKTDVQNDAKENVSYLEKQLDGIADPLLREKLQNLIADEIEKEMVVSKEAFRVVDPVYLSKAFKEKKLYPLVFGVGLFFLNCLIVVFIHAISSADKTDEDKKILEKIRKELLFIKK